MKKLFAYGIMLVPTVITLLVYSDIYGFGGTLNAIMIISGIVIAQLTAIYIGQRALNGEL